MNDLKFDTVATAGTLTIWQIDSWLGVLDWRSRLVCAVVSSDDINVALAWPLTSLRRAHCTQTGAVIRMARARAVEDASKEQ